MQTTADFLLRLATQTVAELGAAVRAAIPLLVMAIIFVSIAYVATKVVLSLLGRFLRGVYLLRDPDFNPSDRVTTQSITGTVASIELRKSRFELDDGDTVVLANRDIEKRWTKEAET